MNNCFRNNQIDPCAIQGVNSRNFINQVNETRVIGPRGPRGCPGQAATITIGTVTTGDVASVTNVGTSTNAILNFVLPNNTSSNAFATLYSTTEQSFNVATGYGNVNLTSSETDNITFDDEANTLTILEPGVYQITYSITPSEGANNGNVAILKNTIPVAGSIKRVVLNDATITSTVDITLNENDVISLGVITTNGTIELTTNPITNATFTVTKIN